MNNDANQTMTIRTTTMTRMMIMTTMTRAMIMAISTHEKEKVMTSACLLFGLFFECSMRKIWLFCHFQ